MKKRNAVIIAAALIACSTFTSCTRIQTLLNKEKQEVVQEEVVISTPVGISTVEKGSITEFHKFGGTVTARDSVTILPDAAGKLVNLLVQEGDKVSKDQIIAEIDPSRAGQNYRLSPVKSTLEGTVTSVPVAYGATVGQGTPIAVVQTLDDLEISFSVIEKYVTLVDEGKKSIVTFDAFPGEEFAATITFVSPTLDTATRSRSIKAKLDNPDERVIAGMYARLSVITTEKSDVIVIPYSAVSVTNSGSYVFVLDGDKARKVDVEIGIRQGNEAEILSGLQAGDQLVTRGQTLLTDGASVRVINY